MRCLRQHRPQVERLVRKMLLKLLSVCFPITLNPASQPLVCMFVRILNLKISNVDHSVAQR